MRGPTPPTPPDPDDVTMPPGTLPGRERRYRTELEAWQRTAKRLEILRIMLQTAGYEYAETHGTSEEWAEVPDDPNATGVMLMLELDDEAMMVYGPSTEHRFSIWLPDKVLNAVFNNPI